MIHLNHMRERSIAGLRNNGYLICFAISLLIIDGVFRNLFIEYGINELYEITPVLFVLFWVSLLCCLAYLIHGKWKKAFMIVMILFFSIYAMGQTAYYNLFSKFFTILDASLLQEGAEFADASYFQIGNTLIYSCIGAFLITLLGCFLTPKYKESYHGKQLLIFICPFLLAFSARCSLPEVKNADVWDASTSAGNIYEDYTDTTKSLLLSGLFEYTFRDVWLAYHPFKSLNDADTIHQLDVYFDERNYIHENNEMTGIFEDKNLMLVQLENIDNWMLTEETMPVMYQLRSEGIDFVNHYATTFATGKTFNTEFIANTGLIPQTKGSAPSYIYSRNSYPFSLANLFKEDGYTVNSFHASNGHVYNRASVHETFGYEQYHNYTSMRMEEPSLDSQMINGYDMMVEPQKFMDFLITISAHGPFDPESQACSNHLEEVQAYSDSDDIVYLCGLAQARETDMFVESLLESMAEDGHLEDTVLIFYTDHYAYGTIDEETELSLKGTNDPNLLSNVAFFVWADGIEAKKVETVTSTVDILPTIANMFHLDVDYNYLIGYDAFSQHDAYVFFQDGAIYDGVNYYVPSEDHRDISEEMKEYVLDANERLYRSWDILTSDYYRKIRK